MLLLDPPAECAKLQNVAVVVWCRDSVVGSPETNGESVKSGVAIGRNALEQHVNVAHRAQWHRNIATVRDRDTRASPVSSA